MSSVRYGLGGNGLLSYAIEMSKYAKETPADTEVGVTNEEIEPANENPHTGMPTGGGGRQPYIQSPDPKDHNFEIPAVIHNADAPIELATGSRTTTSLSNYTEHLFTEADRLPTATFRHVQEDLDMVAHYIGCKADLTAEWSLGDPLQLSLDLTAAALDYDDSAAAPSVSPTLATDVSPYRAHMQGNLTVEQSSDSSLIQEVATVNGGSWGIDNGLEAQHHGGDGSGADREAYSVAETTAADKYDISLDLNVTDTTLYNEAANQNRLVDVEIPFVRQYDSGAGEIVDGVILRASECKLVDAPIPRPGEGVIEGSVDLQPQGGVEIEVRAP
jgi:hypothetical protein